MYLCTLYTTQFQKKPNKKKAVQTRASSDGPTGTNISSSSPASAPSSTTATPQQPHHVKRKTSESKETTPTPLNSEKLAVLSSSNKHPMSMSSSCPVTPATTATGKMVNGGHLPTQQNHHPSSSGGKGSSGKGSSRVAKRRRPSQATDTPHQPTPPTAVTQAVFTPNTSTTSTTSHVPAVAMVTNFATPMITPISTVTPPLGNQVTEMKRVESDGVSSVSPLAGISNATPVRLTTTTASQPTALNHKHTPAAAAPPRSNGTTGGSNRITVAGGLNGSVCDSNALSLGKNDIKRHSDVKVKRENEERTGWNAVNKSATSATAMRDFASTVGGLKPEVAHSHMSRAELMGFLPPHLLQMHVPPMAQQMDAASALFCSERVPGMMSGDLKPVIQPVRHVSARHTPSPRARPNGPLKNDVDTYSTPPTEPYPSIPQHPVDSPFSSRSATELSPSPPCSPIHSSSSSLKKLHHSSSSSSLSSSSISASGAPATTSLLGKNGAIRLTESTIQEREGAEEARMDTDESNLPSQDSPSSALSDNSSSEKERSPPSEQHSRSKGSQSPEGKRRWRSYETEEQYMERKKARRANLNFMMDFSKYLCVCVCVCMSVCGP